LSSIRANTISAANGTDPVTLTKQAAAKAWIVQDTGGTNVTRGSLNISSFTDDGTGDHKLNYSNSFSGSDNYSVTGSTSTTTGGNPGVIQSNVSSTVSLLDFEVKRSTDGAKSDSNIVGIHIHGDLA